ncbi:carboxypeptidase M32 [Paenibacillus sediminis]|uniref:Metal-dependent carboxypeptidase n=1 Tax=Paenibacillus sediminis TaxID=664909 RepID=A0ABS4H012_9BACL|nr:carboxypeptidase M32 [Paenibacillus sediminis]MBP1935867.1 carboxypeptidase Taq [Paenibacillus sediminis]
MEQSVRVKLDAYKELVRKIKSYYESLALMYWDLRTGAPRKGAEVRAASIGVLSTEMFKLQISSEMEEYLQFLMQPDVFHTLSEIDQKSLKESKRQFDLSKKIPPAKYQEYTELTTYAETVWEEAKEKADFAMFEPYLKKIVDMLQEFIEFWGIKGTRYDTLLDMYEPGITVEKLDQVFGRLRDRLVPLIEKVQKASYVPEAGFLNQTFPKQQQDEFGRFILREMGYDFEAGRLDETVHPFETTINSGDVRVTTHYYENDVASALFSTLHEGGHALYEQNVSKELSATPLGEGTSMGIHESQSRTWENMIGRSRSFWKRYFTDLQKHFPEQLNGITVDQFYEGINKSENSLIRIESDELTYNLHIIIRYEIEKMLFNENLSVHDLPKVWNEKYEQYLGISPSHDGEGVLQDVHWAGGSFGYFPSYALGNMYGAQIMNTLRKEITDFESLLEKGELHPIKEWLTDKIYRHGKMLTPSEIIMQVTGEELNPDYLADYLEEKYTEIYKL